jgi:hypothetical protein
MSTRTARASVGGTIINQVGTSPLLNNTPYSIGKVFAVIMDETTPSSEVFQKYGGWDGLGTVFYLDYPNYKDVSNVKLADCKIAKNLYPNQKFFPLREELILLFDAPSKNTQDNKYKVEKYYLSVINLWNNNHHNSTPARSTPEIKLGGTFTENPNINPLLPFEGDSIFEGRTGNSLRFTSTTKYNNKENWWSRTGDNGDPITILSNGHSYNSKSLKPYVEDINKDASSLVLTSTQITPISIRPFSFNTVFNPTDPKLFSNSQAILTGDRVILNAKTDKVLLYGNGIGLSSETTIYLNADKEIVLDAPKVHLGTSNGELPIEPILLGHQTTDLLSTLIKELKDLSTTLSSAQSTPPGTPILQINQAGITLYTALELLTTRTNNLKKLKSTKSYTV